MPAATFGLAAMLTAAATPAGNAHQNVDLDTVFKEARGMSLSVAVYSGSPQGILETSPPVIESETFTTNGGFKITVPAGTALKAKAEIEEFERAARDNLLDGMMAWKAGFQGEVNRDVESRIHDAIASMQQQDFPVLNPAYFYGFLGLENPWLNPELVNPVTGACGLAQITPDTQLQMMANYPEMFPAKFKPYLEGAEKYNKETDKNGRPIHAYRIKEGYNKDEVMSLCKDIEGSLYLANAFAFYQLARIKTIKPNLKVSTTGLYFTHNLDAPDAIRFIENLNNPATANTSTHDLLGDKAERNPKLYGTKKNPFSFQKSFEIVKSYMGNALAVLKRSIHAASPNEAGPPKVALN